MIRKKAMRYDDELIKSKPGRNHPVGLLKTHYRNGERVFLVLLHSSVYNQMENEENGWPDISRMRFTLHKIAKPQLDLGWNSGTGHVVDFLVFKSRIAVVIKNRQLSNPIGKRVVSMFGLSTDHHDLLLVTHLPCPILEVGSAFNIMCARNRLARKFSQLSCSDSWQTSPFRCAAVAWSDSREKAFESRIPTCVIFSVYPPEMTQCLASVRASWSF